MTESDKTQEGRWLVDSCGWLDFFGQNPRGEHFRPHIEPSTPKTHFSSPVVLFEVYRRLALSGFHAQAQEAVAAISHYCTIVPLTTELALKAASLSCEQRLAMADSLILATAREVGATLITSDSDLRDKTGVEFVE